MTDGLSDSCWVCRLSTGGFSHVKCGVHHKIYDAEFIRNNLQNASNGPTGTPPPLQTTGNKGDEGGGSVEGEGNGGQKAAEGPPVGDLETRWGRAIGRVDTHFERCKKCQNSLETCGVLRRLAKMETEARNAYIGAGGKLPTR